jgi:membrane associated rhomboid family serine protease
MLFPYSTDAPVYYWPYTTVGLIVVNTAVFVAEVLNPDAVQPFILQFGQGLQPLQWLTCNFLHAGPMHLIGNMLFLWAFGLIVEGKLGWYKALALYLAIGIAHGAIVQILMLGATSGGALGASAAIFGFMAIALVWAPENEVSCIFLLFFRVFHFDVRVSVLVGLYLLLQAVFFFFGGLRMGSEVLHLVGAAVGFPLGVWLLKAGYVDCEGWDLFSVRAGRHLMTEEERIQEELASPEHRQQVQEERTQTQIRALDDIRNAVRDGHLQLAVKANEHMSRKLPGWALPESDLLALIQALHQNKMWADSISPMAEYLAHYSEKAAAVRLKLGQILVVDQHRPAQALKVLRKLDEAGLDARHRELLAKLCARAEQLHEEDPYELADKDW